MIHVHTLYICMSAMVKDGHFEPTELTDFSQRNLCYVFMFCVCVCVCVGIVKHCVTPDSGSLVVLKLLE